MRHTIPEPPNLPPLIALSASHAPPASLTPYLSSKAAGWRGLTAAVFHALREWEGWDQPSKQGVELTLFAGGPMYLEWRDVRAHRSWSGLTYHQNDLMLRPSTDVSLEVRWRCLSALSTHTLSLHLGQDLIARTFEDVAKCDPTHLILMEHSGFQDPFLTQMAHALWRELQEEAPGGTLFVQSAALMLAIHLVRHYTSKGKIASKSKESSQRLTPKQLSSVIACIQDHTAQDLTLEILAKQAGFSLYHFIRLFRQTTGETPHHFVQRQHIERARHLIAETALPLAQIAQESGFANQSHFARVFKQFVGMTPHTYRQECSR